MTRNRRTWLSVALAALLVAGMLGLAVIGGSIYFVSRHIRTESIADAAAAERLNRARMRFAGQPALIELRDHDQVIVHRPDPPSTRGASLQVLKILVHDSGEGRLIDLEIPFWLLRLMPRRHLSILSDAGVELDAERLRVSVDDLDAYGPGVILDHRDSRGAQVLVWTE